MSTDIALRKTLSDLVHVYETECANVRAAYAALTAAETALRAAFSPYTKVIASYSSVDTAADTIIAGITQDAWYTILTKMEMRQLASITRWKAITENVNEGKMPPLTLQSVYDLLQSASQNVNAIIREACLEVFDILTPGQRQSGQRFKTNSRYGVGKTVILPGYIENTWSGNAFRVQYYCHSQLVQVDRVFHSLDGQSMGNSYDSPLCDAIQTCRTGSGQTDYFAFELYQNCNLHLKFLRPDLVAALNAVAADGRSLKP